MNLTRDFRTIISIFNSPVDYTEDPVRLHGFNKSFTVGDLTYTVNIAFNQDSQMEVQFFISRVNQTGQALATLISGIVGREVSVAEAVRLNREGLGYYSVGVAGTGSSARVFSSVLTILKDFLREKQNIKCIFIKSQENILAQTEKARFSRTDLYRKIIQRAFPGFTVTERSYQDYGVGETEFKLCRSTPEPVSLRSNRK